MEAFKRHGRHMFASLAVHNYRLFFIGQAVSLSGTWMQIVAFGWLVLELSGSGVQLGLVTALQFLPVLFLGPWGGIMADRYDKRTILYYTQGIAMLLSLALGILVATDTISLWMIYTFALSMGLLRVPENPTRQTFVMEIVGKERLSNAIVLNSIEMNLARVVGPVFGGICIATLGIAFCFIVNAVTYIATLYMLFMMRADELLPSPRAEKKKGHLKEGFVYMLATPLIRDILLMMVIIGTFAIEFQVSLPLLAQDTFLGDARSYAALLSAMGAGSVIGGLFASSRKSVSTGSVVRSAFFFAVSLCATALAPSLHLAIFGMAVVGFFAIIMTSQANTLVQLESRADMRGRVMAVWSMAIIGTTPIGGPIIGYVGEHVGPRWGLAVGGIASLFAFFFAWLTLHKKRDALRDDVTREEGLMEAGVENMKVR